MKRKSNIQVGDRIAYSANFLRSTGLYIGPYGALRGQVTEIKPCGSMALAVVQWDKDADAPTLINIANLARVGSAAMSAN